MSKIVDHATLLDRVAAARAAGRSIIHCHGCFDIVHPGHVRYLEFAKRQGDILVVSLTGDSQINKGTHRPYIPQELRAENLAALECVDLVYVDPHPTAWELLNVLRPDIYVKGREYEQSTDPAFTAERAIVASYGGRVLFSSGDVIFSSSRLIEALGRDSGIESQRLAMFCSRYDLSRGSCSSLLESWAGLNVLVVGDLILDRYVLCDATELAGEAAMMSLSRQEQRLYVGGAGVVARHLAGLGANAYLLDAAARDEASRSARQTLENEGIQAHLPACRPSLPEKTRFLVDTQKMLRVEDTQTHPLDSVSVRQAAEWAGSLADHLDAVIYCDFGCGTVTGGLLDKLSTLLAGRRPFVSADASGSRGRLLQFLGADMLCTTERNLRASLHEFDQGLSSVAWEGLNRRARQMLVTLGKKGVVAFDRQSQDTSSPEWQGRLRSEYLPSLAEQAIDPLGSGDALLASATLAMAAGGTLVQAAYLGSAAAAMEAAPRLGNVPIDSPALRRWLSGRIELEEGTYRHSQHRPTARVRCSPA